MSTAVSQPVSGFSSLGLDPAILNILSRKGFTQPTPIQEQAIPLGVAHHDVVGIAQTGTGKTLAFGLPIIQDLLANSGRALVVVPTRELALQVEENLHAVTRSLPVSMRTVCLIGGIPIYRQIRDLQHHPRILVATPGRLNDHLMQKTIDLNDVRTVVLDEADRMLDMGFAPQIKKILDVVPSECQTMLFSATMAPEVAAISQQYLKNPQRVEVARAGSHNEQIEQELCYVSQSDKLDLLSKILSETAGTVLVFTRTKHGASRLAKQVFGLGHTSAEIHSNRSLSQRRQALDGFKSGRYRVLVATDVAARGIDVPDISLVINFDLPDASEDYVHRIGRTGRAGKIGKAIAFAAPDQWRDVKAIERLLDTSLALSPYSLPVPSGSGSSDGRPPRSGRFNHQRQSQPSTRPYRPERPAQGGYQSARPARPSDRNRSSRRSALSGPKIKLDPRIKDESTSSKHWMRPRPSDKRDY